MGITARPVMAVPPSITFAPRARWPFGVEYGTFDNSESRFTKVPRRPTSALSSLRRAQYRSRAWWHRLRVADQAQPRRDPCGRGPRSGTPPPQRRSGVRPEWTRGWFGRTLGQRDEQQSHNATAGCCMLEDGRVPSYGEKGAHRGWPRLVCTLRLCRAAPRRGINRVLTAASGNWIRPLV